MEMFSKRKSHWEIAILEIENAYIDPKILRRQYSSGDLRDPSDQFCLYIADVIFIFQWTIILTLS